MSEHIDIVRLRRAVRPLADPPQPPGWNATEFPELWSDNTPLRQAAVLLPVICRGDALSMLFTRRNETMRHHAGQISFPGGAMDAADRDPIAAALRETDEETGIDARFVEAFGYLDCFDTISGFSVTPVVAPSTTSIDATSAWVLTRPPLLWMTSTRCPARTWPPPRT